MPRVFSKRGPHPPHAVLVDRSTPYGNPFKVGQDGSREDVIDKYEFWISQPEQVELRVMMARELRGKDLLCWCTYPSQRPKMKCHADIILKIANPT